MEDSYIIANFHALCRLCMNKSSLMISIFDAAPDDECNVTVTSKISEFVELQMEPNDGLPARVCYKCLFTLETCSKFKSQCIQNENRFRQITHQVTEMDTSNSSELSNHTQEQKHKPQEYLVEDSVVMVVDPSLDYDSTEESDNHGEQVERISTPEEPIADNFLKNVPMCQYCDRSFVTEEKCQEHEQSYHDPHQPYKCIECSLVVAERSQFAQHLKQVHGNDKPYSCTECEKGFGRRSDLRKHSIVHTGIRPYQCHYCMKSFSRNTNLSKHLRIHSGSKPHVCPLCPRSFVGKGDLQRHVLIHSSTKPFACQKCPLTFCRRDKLVKHQVRHQLSNQSDQGDMIVNVNPFTNVLTSPTQLRPHSNTEFDLPRIPEHISGESSFINQVQRHPSTSGKQVQSPTKLKPVSNRNKPKNIKCHQCPKRFSSLDAYKTHVSIAHVGSRVFQCKECFKKFSRKRELDRHATLHTGMKPFSCSQCDKTFNKKDKLDKHEETHECLVVNLPCIECGETFEKKADLVAHIKSHFSDNFEDRCAGTDADTEIKKEEEPEADFTLDESFYDLET